MTAAACVNGASGFLVMAGTTNLTGVSGTEQSSPAVEWIVHPEWTGFTINANVALLRVQVPYVFNGSSQR